MEKASKLPAVFGSKTKVGADSLFIQGNNLQDLFSAVRAVAKWEQPLAEELNFDAAFGPHYLSNHSTKKSEVIPVALLKLSYYKPDKLGWSIAAVHDYAYIDGFHPGAIMDKYRITTINPWVNYHWVEKLRTQFSANIKVVNDGNVKTDPELTTSYALIKNKNTVWLGAGVQQIAFSQNTWKYWSPTRIVNFGPRIEMDWHFSRHVKTNLRFSGNRTYDQDPKAWGHNYYSYVDLQYQKTNGWKIALAWERIETQVNHGLWFLNQLTLNAEALF